MIWSINHILLSLLEGRVDKLGFKSHRLPYGQQWFKYIFKFQWDIIIQTCGINWGKQQTRNQLHNSKPIKGNNLRFSKHIQNSLLHGTQSSKVVGLNKGNNILTTNYTIQTKYRKWHKVCQSSMIQRPWAPFLRLMQSPIRWALPPTNNGHTTLFPNSFPLNTKKPATFPTLWTTYSQKEPITLGVHFIYHASSTTYIWIKHTTTCNVVVTHSHWGTGYMFSKHTYSCNTNRALAEVRREVEGKPSQSPPC